MAKKPIIPLRFAPIPPHIHIATLSFIDFFGDWDEAIVELLARLQHSFERDREDVAELPPDPFREHLERLCRHVVEELRRTVLDPEDVLQLRASEASGVERVLPVAYRSRRPSWFGPAKVAERQFDSFGEVFQHHYGHVVLLGDPGGGKTTTLLAFAREAVNRRLADPQAPLPIYVPIRTWDGRSDLVAWMAWAAELGLPRLQDELRSGRVMVLLDGLDELRRVSLEDSGAAPDPRLKFLESVGTLGPISLVITCRTADFHELAASPAALMAAAVTVRLMPLTDGQISQYLDDDPNLLAVIMTDAAFLEMAHNPLILTLLALAYRDEGDQARDLVELARSSAEVRTRIFEKYVARRYEFELARLDEGLAPRFTLEEIYDRLGAAALELLNKFQRVTIDIHENGYTVTQAESGPVEIDTVEFDVRSLRYLLGPVAVSVVAFAERLHLLVPVGPGSVRFAHLLLRDHFALPYCAKQLAGGAPETRRGAAGALGMIGNRQAIPHLIQALDDSDVTVRVLAVWALGEIGDPEAIGPLLDAVRRTEQDTWTDLMVNFALEALGKLGGDAIEPLRQVLAEDGETIPILGITENGAHYAKQYAVRGLAHIGTPAVPTLIAALEQEDVLINDEVARALGAIGDTRAIEPLIQNLQAFPFHWETVRALERIGDPQVVSAMILAWESDFSVATLNGIAKIGGSEAANALRRIIRDPDPGRRRQAADAFGVLGGAEALDELQTALDDPDLRVRGAAVEALERLAFDPVLLAMKRPSVDELIAGLSADDSGVRAESAWRLGELADSRTADALVDAAADQNPWVRRTVLLALAALRDRRAIGPLAELLFKTSSFKLVEVEVDVEVVGALGQITDLQAARHLIEALDDDPHSFDRGGVENALVSIGEPAVEPLLAALCSEDQGLQQMVAPVLTSIGAPAVDRLVTLLDADVSAVAAYLLARIGGAAVPPLMKALGAQSARVRAAGAAALGSIGDARAIGPLAALLSDTDVVVRTTAADALGDIGEPAVERLLEMLDSPDTSARAAGVSNLAWTGDPRAVPALVEALADPEPLVRRNAVRGLGLIAEPGTGATLRPLREDPDVLVRLAAVDALTGGLDQGDLQQERPSVDELFGALAHTDAALRADAVRRLTGLAEVVAARVSAELGNALSDPDALVRSEAAHALAALGIVEPLITGLRGPDEATRAECVAALIAAQPAAVVPVLINLLVDQDKAIRTAATDVLSTMPTQSGPELARLLSDERFAPAAAEVIRRIGEPAVQPMIELLLGEDDLARSCAIAILLGIGRPAVRPLIDALSPNSGYGALRQYAAEVIGLIGHPRGHMALVAVLSDENRAASWDKRPAAFSKEEITVRMAAVQALARSGHPLAAPALRGIVKQRNRRLRQAGKEALAGLDQRSAAPVELTHGD